MKKSAIFYFFITFFSILFAFVYGTKFIKEKIGDMELKVQLEIQKIWDNTNYKIETNRME